MSLHTFAIIVFSLMCANEVRGLFEKIEWTPARVFIGIPLSISIWILLIWLVFYP
jgi:hypothetical protein